MQARHCRALEEDAILPPGVDGSLPPTRSDSLPPTAPPSSRRSQPWQRSAAAIGNSCRAPAATQEWWATEPGAAGACEVPYESIRPPVADALTLALSTLKS